MKRKSLLFLLLMAAFAPWAANAQEQTVITCYPPTQTYATGYTDGTTKTSGEMYTQSGGGEQGWMKFDVSSIPDNATIDAITLYFYTTSANGPWVRLTSAGELDPATASASDLYTAITTDSPNYFTSDHMSGFSANAWKSVVMSSSAIEKLQTNGLTNDYFTLGFHEYETGNYYLHAAGYEDANKPYLEVTCTVPVTCSKPTLSNDVTTTETTATISWTPSSAEQTLFDIYWSTSSAAPTDATTPGAANQTGTSYTIPGLTPGTNYYVWIRGNCGTETSPDYTFWTSAVGFTTQCQAIAALGYDEKFDTYTYSSGFLPNCWTRINGGTSYNTYPSIYNSSAYSTSNCLRFYTYGSATTTTITDQYVVLPEMTGLDGLQITFMAKGYNSGNAFKIGQMSDPTDVSTFNEIGSKTLTTTYEECNFNLTNKGNYIAILVEKPTSSSTTTIGVYIDNISIHTPPTCAKPTNLDVTASGLNVTATWESEESQWQVAYATSATADPNNNIQATVTTKTYTTDPLTIDNDYYFWVRSYCSASDQSDWVGPQSVHIGYCTPAPTSVDGSGINNVTFGTGPVVNDNLSMTSQPYYYNHSDQVGAGWPNSTIDMSINYVTNYSYYTWVWVDWDNDFEFTDAELVYTPSTTISSGVLSIQFTIPTATALGDYRMRIQGADNSSKKNPCYTGSYSYLVDYTLRVIEEPSCLPTTDLEVLAATITDNSAFAQWDDSQGSEWNIRYKKTSETDWTPMNGLTTNSCTMSPLEAGEEYEVQVQTVCTGATSTWSGSVTFITAFCAASDMCTLTFELTDSYGDSWNGAYIEVVDVLSGVSLAQMANENLNGTTGSGENELNIKTLGVCDGREIQFVWHSGSWDSEASYVVKDVNGETIFSGSGAMSAPVNYTVDCTISDCRTPTAFTATEPGPDRVNLAWTENGVATEWTVAFRLSTDTDFTERTATVNPYTLQGLESEKDYVVKVRPNCSDASIKWSDEVTFTTTAACPAPYDITVSPKHETATISWTGYNDNYTVYYRQGATAGATLLEEHFDGDDMPTGWTTAGSGTSNWSVVTSNNAGAAANEVGLNWTPQFSGTSRLVTPAIDLTGITKVIFTSNISVDWYESTGTIGVATSSDDGTTWNSAWSQSYSGDDDTPIEVVIDNADMGQASVLFSIYYTGSSFNYDYLYFDDIVIAEVVESGAFVAAAGGTNITATTFELTGLTMDTPYEVKIEGHCGSTIVESTVKSFRTLSAKTKFFVTAGNWNVSSSWYPVGEPTATNDVIIQAAAVIPDGCIATANNVTLDGTAASVTIQDGGQLFHANDDLVATIEKHIDPYKGTKDNYYLIANPLNTAVDPTTVTNMISNNYDLYAFDGTQTNEEWQNYENSTFNLAMGNAYLYANDGDVTLSFTGTLRPIPGSGYVGYVTGNYLPYNPSGTGFANWSLIGNPHPCNAYIVMCTYSSGLSLVSGYTDFYKMNDTHDEIIASTGAVAPLEGVFVVSQASNNIAVSSSIAYRGSYLNLNLSKSNSIIDAVRIRFAEGEGMEKMQLNPNHTKIYIPQDGKDYAVVYSEGVGEMPVSFKAETNSSYTLTFSNEEISFSYLHLIDNLTGADVDLLANPSYSFDAQTTDYAQRFRLVFATGSSVDGDSFGFINGSGNLSIFGIEGEATIQVMDVTGRILSSDTFSGSYEKNLNVVPGVYMLRLINGNDVKVQKIVVR